ncbi:MAG TPA: HD domain-containing protein [Bauldia sp.]|nr:HD domain-containing protein [Bauldia sp.]
MKHTHEFRDPVHTFINVRSDERAVIDSRAFQRLRHVHQLALTYLVYPGATHRRFEHSLGVMELATRIFDVVTDATNVLHPSVREIIPDADALRYWRSVLRMAALCHDMGHLPFSHAAEDLLLPPGFSHETLSVSIICSPAMEQLWLAMTPPLRSSDIVKLAVGKKKAPRELKFSIWETILSEIIVGDSFGADRMDYLLRDSYHAGVQYGRFDHNRLINTLRILPQLDKDTVEPALGLDAGGLESSEALILARHFIFSQVYYHHIRRIYDLHLIDFLAEWLPSGKFPVVLDEFLSISDSEVIAAIRREATGAASKLREFATRIENRKHFKRLYSLSSEDKTGGILNPGKVIFDLAKDKFGADNVKHDFIPAKIVAPDFPVLYYDDEIHSSLKVSRILPAIPTIEVDRVYCNRSIVDEAIRWRKEIKVQALNLSTQGKLL